MPDNYWLKKYTVESFVNYDIKIPFTATLDCMMVTCSTDSNFYATFLYALDTAKKTKSVLLKDLFCPFKLFMIKNMSSCGYQLVFEWICISNPSHT